MAEGAFVQSHGVKMLSHVKKLEDLKVRLENDTYIDVILQSLPPSYDSFIVNYNMNELEKRGFDLQGGRQGCRRWKRKKGKGTTVTATASTEGAPTARREGKGKVGVLSGRRQMMCACITKERGIGRGSVHNSSPTQVLERSRKLSKDEMVLRLGAGKAVAAEAMGSLSLVVSNRIRIHLKDSYFVPINDLYILQQSNLIITAQHKRKMDNHENAQIWHTRLGHISKDRIRKLVDSKNLEIDNLNHLSTCVSCLKGKVTKKPFVGQSAIANGLLDLVHTDVCGPLSIPARGGFSYFITFTDDHSRYGYVYLMRYKSEAFGRFKEYRLEVENQTNRKIKALRLDRGGEYLSGEFIDYLKENEILSQWTPPGTPQLIGVAERRNRTLLDMVRSMMSFTELPPSFWGYALETTAKLLNVAPSKSVPQMPYKIWHGKPASYKYLRVWGSPAYVKRLVGDKLDSRYSLCRFIEYPKETVGYYFYDPTEQMIFASRNSVFLKKGFPSDSRRDEVLIEESSEEFQHESTISFEPTVHTNSVPVLCRSTRESRVPERYGFVGLISQLDNDPKTYGEAMSDIDLDKWLVAMKSEIADGEVTAFKTRLVAKGYTQRPGVDFEETYSPVTMAKSIRILLAIAAWVSLLLERNRKSVISKGPSTASSKLSEAGTHILMKSYGIMISSRTTMILVYTRRSGSSVAYLVLYVDDILLIRNDVKMLGDIKAWLSTQFSMKDMGEASYILGIKIYRDRSRRMLGLM
ncbi:UNVERIFIED_CONTAM: hypothetical protein Slati_1430000 [Sesamum latifolium]|uniref:Integrase catalytic domain-containing protein n=1 Tax=Sesamum latifolium TaxID=2727402 RepID=A0AAW2X9A0_9LAMI